jgi:hypothetical protein
LPTNFTKNQKCLGFVQWAGSRIARTRSAGILLAGTRSAGILLAGRRKNGGN